MTFLLRSALTTYPIYAFEFNHVFQGSMKLEGRKNNSSIEESMKLI